MHSPVVLRFNRFQAHVTGTHGGVRRAAAAFSQNILSPQDIERDLEKKSFGNIVRIRRVTGFVVDNQEAAILHDIYPVDPALYRYSVFTGWRLYIDMKRLLEEHGYGLFRLPALIFEKTLEDSGPPTGSRSSGNRLPFKPLEQIVELALPEGSGLQQGPLSENVTGDFFQLGLSFV